MKHAVARVVIGIVGVAIAQVAATQQAARQGGDLTAHAESPEVSPEVIDVQSGALTLRAQVWRPSGSGPFPAVLFNHGSYSSNVPLPSAEPETIGPVFARHGYVFLWLHRQGTGLSSAQGVSEGDQMGRAFQAEGVAGRNRVQLQLLDRERMNEANAALARLRARADVDARRIAVVGHSFGGSLSVLMAAQDPEIRAIVVFGGAAGSWTRSEALRERLLAAVRRMSATALFIYAKNDYSTAPGTALATAMQGIGKPHALKIYPPFGADSQAGHNLVFRSVPTWEADVFAFLDAQLRR